MSPIKRNTVRALLVLHLLGIALVIGSRAADVVIYRQTGHAGLQMLAFGRDLAGTVGHSLTTPSLWLIIATGVAMTLLRFGRRPPGWVWLKVGVTVLVLVLAPALVGPALRATQQLAHWSAEHQQLAPELAASAARASLYGLVVFALFVLNIAVAVWKPFVAGKRPLPGGREPATLAAGE